MKSLFVSWLFLAQIFLCQEAFANVKIGLATNQTPAWIYTYAGTALNLTGMTQTFNDNFSSSSDICASSTSTTTGCNWYAPQAQQYGLSTFAGLGGNYIVSGGVLTLRTLKSGGNWYSGGVQSVNSSGVGFSQSGGGYFEASMQLPYSGGSPVANTWPAFWLVGLTNITIPAQRFAELDAFELYTDSPGYITYTEHIWNPSPYHSYVPGGNFGTYVDGTYHKFGILVNSSWVIVYVDRLELARQYVQNFDLMPLYMIMSNALFSTPGDSNNRDLLINNVQVWH